MTRRERRSGDAGEGRDRRRAGESASADRRGGGGGRRRSDWEHAAQGRRATLVGGGTLVGLGFVGGLTLGAAVWDRLMAGGRRGLFSAHPLSRYHAVSYLAARPSVDTARLLRDYVRWEPHPLLRRRARRVLRAVEASL